MQTDTATMSALPGQIRRSEMGFRPDTLIAAVSLSSLFLIPILGGLAPLVFLAFGLLLAARKPASTIDALTRNWYILVLPMFALTSTLWSIQPALSMRYGIQFVLTVCIAIVVAHRISAYAFINISFFASLFVIIASILSGGARADGIALGIFAAKNAYATSITMFALAAMGMLLAPQSIRAVKLVALFGLLATPALLASAESSGAIATMAIATVAFIALAIAGYMKPKARQSYFRLLFGTSAVVALLVLVFHEQLLALLLELFEKDATITGRTELWEIGSQLIGERPFLGLGYQAFWVQETALAEELWAYFLIASRMGFHFHNTYISIGVELGLIGSGLTALLLFGSLVRSVQWATKEPFGTPVYFVAFAVLVVCRSLVEVDVFYQFSTTSITIICGLIYANQALAAYRAERAQFIAKNLAKSGQS